MGADVLATQGAMSSAAMILAMLDWIDLFKSEYVFKWMRYLSSFSAEYTLWSLSEIQSVAERLIRIVTEYAACEQYCV